MKKTTVIKLIKYSFGLAGLGMILGAVYFFSSTQSFVSQAATARGTVIDLEYYRSSSDSSGSYRPVVRFITAAGEEIVYHSTSGSNPPSYSAGEEVRIYYDPALPNEAKIDSFLDLWFAPTLLAGMGSIFGGISGGIFLVGYLKARKKAFLKRQGRPIESKLQSVSLNGSYSVNGQHPYRIVTQWHNPQSGEILVFYSDDLWYDPSDYIEGEEITVLIDPNDPERYWMDISFLPNLAD